MNTSEIFSVSVNWLQLAPLLSLLVTALITLLYSVFAKNSNREMAGITLVGIASGAVFNFGLLMQSDATYSSFGVSFITDRPAIALNFVIFIGLALTVLSSYGRVPNSDLDHPEYYPLLLLSSFGAMVMVSSADLITLVLGLEILSLPVYALAGFRVKQRISQEAGMKYFLLGAFASAILIYGAALMYGAGGSFTYAGLQAAIATNGFTLLASAGALLVFAGLGFKAALAPFHQWAPDVYTGAPTTVTTFMSVVVKVAAFAGLTRFVVALFPELDPILLTIVGGVVIATLLIGNLAALAQQSVKRLLAYSAVAHAGYLGLALLLTDPAGTVAIAWYLTAYTVMNAGAFIVLTIVSQNGEKNDSFTAFSGLGKREPFLAFTMTIFMLSLGGIPPLAGFAGKFLVFEAAIQGGYIWLAVAGILTSVIALVYYFRVIIQMWFVKPSSSAQPITSDGAERFGLVLALAATVLLGIFPAWWEDLLRAGRGLFGL